ncbi:DEAD/DEAH box helicase [Campylobacter sp. RM16188]|uniref:DEAD/DEAH box helicase n=1 Tax=Campylobacter sp. RM16188 TaxID=1705725 RepID=UPI001551D363|nr:DEAD/DEAH box helicase family protein [Campylobacter sp. RM16188]
MSENLIDINYAQSGKSKSIDSLGMRQMQAKAYAKRNEQYLLIKAPPASGKSRALMFIALDKLCKQGLNKVIVAVPERSIGASFRDTDLKSSGYGYNWKIEPQNNLVSAVGENSKIKKFIEFINSNDEILLCTHATLRFAYEAIGDDAKFNDCVLAIDEFHHVSSDYSSVLGNAIRNIMRNSTAHIIAMTGSYFRGDSAVILEPEDEEKFAKVTYTYYEQLNGYEYLKSFGIGYHFYTGSYLDALGEVLDTDKKTIIHIPSVNSSESTKDKYNEVDSIVDIIGEFKFSDENGVYHIERKDGKILKVADLVTDSRERDKVSSYLRQMQNLDDMDIIIALNMAKEGFDWPWCEHALTIGYRGSLTEIVQIIGRCTRDSSNKKKAQFTNLIASPDASQEEVKGSVNTMLKAISASLLMEQVLAPDIKFKPRKNTDEKSSSADYIYVKGLKEPSNPKVKEILENDLHELRASILSDNDVQRAMASRDPKLINNLLIPKVIQKVYPNLNDSEIDEVRQHVITDLALKNARFENVSGNREFIKMANKLVLVDELDINLIEKICPFQEAYKLMSKKLDAPTLKIIQKAIDAQKIEISEDELLVAANKIKQFYDQNSRLPDRDSDDEFEKRLAYALAKLQSLKNRQKNG